MDSVVVVVEGGGGYFLKPRLSIGGSAWKGWRQAKGVRSEEREFEDGGRRKETRTMYDVRLMSLCVR